MQKSFCQLLGIIYKISTTYHPKTDRQTENANQQIEIFLSKFVNYRQDDWVKWLPSAKFATNAAVSSLTQVSPFYASFGTELRIDFKAAEGPIQPRSITEFVYYMEKIYQYCQDEITYAQAY